MTEESGLVRTYDMIRTGHVIEDSSKAPWSYGCPQEQGH